MSAFDKPIPSKQDAERLSKYFTIMGIPKPGIKIGDKVYNGKAACIKDWPNLTEAQMSTQMPTWFDDDGGGKNEYNVGMILSNKGLVIDSDGEKCEAIIWTKIVPGLSNDLQDAFRTTARTRTGGGGEHIIFGIRREDFPQGVPTKNIIKLGDHEEIKLLANGSYVVERGIHQSGKEYLPSNDIEKLVYLSKEQVEELLAALSNLKPGAQRQRPYTSQQQQQEEKEEEVKVYSLDDAKIEIIVKELEPCYQNGSRDEITFSCSGCLHKWQIDKDSAMKIIEGLVLITNDEELDSRRQTVHSTYEKNRNSSEVSGWNRFVQAVVLVTQNRLKAEEIVRRIGRTVIQARKEQGDNQDEKAFAPGQGQEETKEQEQPDEDEELAAITLTKQDIYFAFNTMIKEAKYDGLSIRQIFHGFNSTFTKTPIPHVINSKNSGAGKSYLLNHVAAFYPEKYILTLAGISDKAIFHSDGPMVIEDKVTGEIKLLEPIINDLETEVESLQEKDPKGNKKKIKEIESQIKSIQRSAQKLIDLNNKIIILQDTPPPTVFNLLMTLLSQDSPKDQIYAFTDKTSGSGKLIQSRNRIRGMPVIFTTQVIDDTDSQRFEEKNRRFIHVTPNTSKEKIREANRLTAIKYGYLKDEYDKLLVNRADLEKAKRVISIIIAKLKEHTKHLESKDTGVKIPFALAIEESLPDDGRVWQMTVGERLMKYLSMNTKLFMDSRPRLVHKETGAFYPIATFDDLKDTLVLMERAATNLRPYLAEWYSQVFLVAFKECDGKPNEYQNDIGIVYQKENRVGLTTEQLAKRTKEIMQCPRPSTDDIRETYLDPLINHGLVDKTPSAKDNRQNIYHPVDSSERYDTSAISNKVRVKDPDLYPTNDVIIESYSTLVEYPASDTIFFDQMSKYKIIDVDGSQIGLDELADKYYSNPQDYFDKGFTPEQEANSELRKNIFLTRRQGVILQAFSKNVNEQSTSDNGAVTKL